MPVKKATTAKRTTKKVSPAVSPVSSEKGMQTLAIRARFSNRNLVIGLIVLVVVIAALLLRNQIIVATVNGQPISRLALIQELEKESGKKTLDTMITTALIYQEAGQKNATASDADVNAELKKVDDSLKKQGQDLNSALKAQGMTLDSLKDQIKIQLTLKKLLADKIKVTDKEVADYIQKNKDTLPKMDDAQLKASVKSQLEQDKMNTAVNDFIQSLRAKAKISLNLFQ